MATSIVINNQSIGKTLSDYRFDAAASATAAQQAADEAASDAGAAASSATTATNAATTATAAATTATNAATTATAAATTATNAATTSTTAATTATAAATTATTAATTATAAATTATTAATTATAAATTATTAATTATAAATTATTAATTATAAATTATTAATTATAAATTATTAATTATDAAGTATTAATTATDAAASAQSSALTCATWAVLSTLTGSTAGQGAEVLDSDTGTHTDPVVGGTVSNAGRYTWSASPAGWQRIGDTGLSQVNARIDATDTRTASVELGTNIMNSLLRIATPEPDARQVLDIANADGTVEVFSRLVVPAGNFPLTALDADAQARMAFTSSVSLLSSALRVVGTAADGRDYVMLDIKRNGSLPIQAFVSRAQSTDGEADISGVTDLVLIGDSMTAAGSGISDTLPARYPERVVYTSAEGGEKTASIAVSFGVTDLLTLALTGNAIPTSGTVTVTPSVGFLNDGMACLVDVTGETGTATRCRIYNVSGTYSLRPVSYPAVAVRVQSAARARVVSLQVSGTDPTLAQLLDPLYDKTAIIRAGRNDIGYAASYDGAAVVALIERIAALMRSGRYIVLGPTNGVRDVDTSHGGTGTISDANSVINLGNVIDLNSRLAARFPGKFFSPMANFAASAGATTTFTISGSDYIVADATVLVDGIHENSTGKGLTCDLIEAAITALEY